MNIGQYFSSAKRLCVGLVFLFLLIPQVGFAAMTNQQVLALIDSLLQQVAALQALLDEQRALDRPTATVARPTPYNLQFFAIEPEAVYRIHQARLVSSGPVQADDQVLFTLLRETIGDEAFLDHTITEFWTFREEREVLSGFVERRADNGEWIVGVNRANFDSSNPAERAAFRDLFVHEYAHIVLLDNLNFTREFTTRFWSSADTRRSEQAARLPAGEQFDALQSSYEAQAERFVSPYALMNVDEDIAETFVAFVQRDRPLSPRTLVDQKISFFWQDPRLRAERERIRLSMRE